MSNRWSTDINSWDKISPETANLFMSLAEKRLDESVETSKNITSRNHLLLAFCVSLLSGLIGYLATIEASNLFTTLLPLSAFVAIVMTVPAFFIVAYNAMPFKVGTTGEEPKIIVRSQFIDVDFDNHEQFINLVLQVCETYQFKLDENLKVNVKRQSRLSIASYLMMCLPLSFLSSWIVLSLIQ